MLETSLEEAVQFVVPVCRTAKEKVQALREWAQNRAVHTHRREQGGAGRLTENASVICALCGRCPGLESDERPLECVNGNPWCG